MPLVHLRTPAPSNQALELLGNGAEQCQVSGQDDSGHQASTQGQGMSQALGAGPGGKQGPCMAEQVEAPKGGQRAVRQQSYGPAGLAAAPL